MRIVGGSLGGRRFSGPPGDGTRPTSERAREAIASALDARGWLEDAVVLDLFAGTGALAFEALSRGAARAFLVEKSRVVARAIEKSARELGLSDRATVIQADLLAGRGQSRWLASIEPASLVFFDPPYAEIAAVDSWQHFFPRLGLALPRRAVVERRLLDAIDNSHRKGYHR